MKKFLFISALLCASILPLIVFAQATISVTPISPYLPGSLNAASSPGAYIKNFYSYALFISGLLAFGAIIYGGIKYTIGRGNPSQESEARSWIYSALLGMLLLAAAYLILYTVNPNLVNLTLPNLPSGTLTLGPTGPGYTGSNYSGPGAACAVPPSGGCSVSALTAAGGNCFGANESVAAGVCNVESANGALLNSGTDKCDDGSPVSFGLFQINISANSIQDPNTKATLNCSSAFSNPYTGTNQHCTITNQALYQQCKTAALNPVSNVAEACKLSQNGTTFQLWGTRTKQLCGL